jgi:hypothetical protein
VSVTKHAPGPWEIIDITISKLHEPNIVDARGELVCKLPALSNCHGDVNVRAPQIAANAHLIAAAPELLEALRRAESALRNIAANRLAIERGEIPAYKGIDSDNIMDAAYEVQAALAKAEGVKL